MARRSIGRSFFTTVAALIGTGAPPERAAAVGFLRQPTTAKTRMAMRAPLPAGSSDFIRICLTPLVVRRVGEDAMEDAHRLHDGEPLFRSQTTNFPGEKLASGRQNELVPTAAGSSQSQRDAAPIAAV